jgi:hypothetical protein
MLVRNAITIIKGLEMQAEMLLLRSCSPFNFAKYLKA